MVTSLMERSVGHFVGLELPSDQSAFENETPSTELTESGVLFAYLRKQIFNHPPY
jgi:hypothetical protein